MMGVVGTTVVVVDETTADRVGFVALAAIGRTTVAADLAPVDFVVAVVASDVGAIASVAISITLCGLFCSPYMSWLNVFFH